MIFKNVNEITKADIDGLVERGEAESKTLEYKSQLPSQSENEKKEFLADVSALANASGGDLIFGIAEKEREEEEEPGLPDRVQGIPGQTVDIARLEKMIHDGIAPRFPFQIRKIAGWGEGGLDCVVVIRVPKSFASPHMVTLRGSRRFFSRRSTGKYPLEVDEIRNAFLATDSQAERLRAFHVDRLGKIASDETPILLSSPRRLVLHTVPISSFLSRERLVISDNIVATGDLRPMEAQGWDYRFNLDGSVTYSCNVGRSESLVSYCLLFFDGSIESVLSGATHLGEQGTTDFVSIAYLLLEYTKLYLPAIKSLGVLPPVSIFAALMGCKGCRSSLNVRGRFGIETVSNLIDRDPLMLPEILLEDFDASLEQAMRPMLDALWNAGGVARCPLYNEAGTWVGVR